MATTIEMAKKLQAQKLTKGQAETIAVLIRENQGEIVTRDVLTEVLETQKAQIVNEVWKIGLVYCGLFFALSKYFS